VITWIVAAMIGGIFVGGLACVVAAWRAWRRTTQRMRLGGLTEGIVVDLTPQGLGEETAYVTVFEFVDRHGVRRRVSSRIAWSPARHAVGQRVRVSYDPARSEDAEIVAEARGRVALALLGAALAAMALLLWWGMWIGAFMPE
jgi:hypothetical protein